MYVYMFSGVDPHEQHLYIAKSRTKDYLGLRSSDKLLGDKEDMSWRLLGYIDGHSFLLIVDQHVPGGIKV